MIGPRSCGDHIFSRQRVLQLLHEVVFAWQRYTFARFLLQIVQNNFSVVEQLEQKTECQREQLAADNKRNIQASTRMYHSSAKNKKHVWRPLTLLGHGLFTEMRCCSEHVHKWLCRVEPA